DVPPLHEIVHRRGLADVGHVDADLVLEPLDVVEVAAVVGDERVDEKHVGAEVRETVREVAADASQAAGDHDAAAAIERLVAHDGWPTPRCDARSRCAGRWLRRMTSSHHNFSTSTPVRPTRLKLKNCDLPCARW